jgi:hypothetical protein
MTVSNHLYLLAIGLVVIGWETRVHAEGDVTIYTPPPAAANASTDGASTPDDTPIIHKSLHKNKAADSETAVTATTESGVSSTGTKPAITPVSLSSSNPPASTSAASPTPPTSSTHIKPVPAAYWAPGPNPVQTAMTPSKNPTSFGPPVETGLPVARHTYANGSTTVDPMPIPISATLPAVTYAPGTTAPHPTPATGNATSAAASRTVLASALSALPEITTPSLGTASKKYSSSADNLASTTPVHKGPKNIYPWKKNIITTMFYIGEGPTPISSTTNEASAWDEDWRRSNGGADSPNDRNGYAPASHAARVNPFYVALPFNDLAFPDKARRWLPTGWYRPPRDGKQISACKDRWVEIKNQAGRSCFAQWEDVGPLRYDQAEYVFGSERPDTYTRAGLDVGPAVIQYLNLNDKNPITSWRFVDDEDVPPGVWLKYDEQALLFRALHELKASASTRSLPIQRASGPIDDATNDDSNKKKIGAAKG